MLGVLLTILGIIGRILLIILFVVLVILAVILFVPITYRGYARKNDHLLADLDAGWLIRLLHAKLHYSSEDKQHSGPHIFVKLALWTLYDNSGKKSRRSASSFSERRKEAEREAAARDSEQYEDDFEDAESEDFRDDKRADSGASSGENSAQKATWEDGGIEQPESSKNEKASDSSRERTRESGDTADEKNVSGRKEPGLKERLLSAAEKIRSIFHKIAEAVKKLAAKISSRKDRSQKKGGSTPKKSFSDRLEEFLDKILDLPDKLWDKMDAVISKAQSLYDKKEIVARILDENETYIDRSLVRLKKLLIHIMPKIDRLYLHFGFEDPATTGKVLGYLSVLYPACQDKMELVPEFEEKVFEGEVKLHGHIFIIVVLVYVLPIVLNKRFFAIMKKLRKMKAD